MTVTPSRRALIVGAGPGLGASLARVFAGECGMHVAVAARRLELLVAIGTETGAVPLVADASQAPDVDRLFGSVALALGGDPYVVVYNASQRVRGPFAARSQRSTQRPLRGLSTSPRLPPSGWPSTR